jgi:CSLREA domain-containing protein
MRHVASVMRDLGRRVARAPGSGGPSWVRLGTLLGLATLAFAPSATPIAQAATFTVFTVNATADTDDGSCDPLGQGTGNKDCTLREAINAANAHANASTATADRDRIAFAIPSSDPGFTGQWFQIEPQTELPTIQDPVVIDAETQPGYSGHPLVEIRGLGNDILQFSGLQLATGQNTVRGLAVDGFVRTDLLIEPDPSQPCDHCDDANLIEDSYFGLDPSGRPSPLLTAYDVEVSGSSSNTIRNNRIAAADGAQVYIHPFFSSVDGSTAYPTGNVLEGNFIGTTPDGSALALSPLGIEGQGIELDSTVGTRIGGAGGGAGHACTGSCNLIATYPSAGVLSYNDTGAVIEGNFMGSDITGAEDLTPGGGGIGVEANDDTQLQIEGNLISGNDIGVEIDADTVPSDPGSSDVAIAGNYIGTEVSGTKPLIGNSQGGWGILTSYPRPGAVTIGGGPLGSSCSDPCNVIAGYYLGGVQLGINPDLGLKVDSTLLRGNFIGSDVNGHLVAGLGNGFADVGIASSGNTVKENLIYSSGRGVTVFGNDNTIEQNVIAHNAAQAVEVHSVPGWSPPCCSGNLIRSNEIFANGFGIDLLTPGACDGVDFCGGGPTPNDPGDSDGIADGANELQNFPVVTSAVSGGGETTITYSLNSHPSTHYTLEFFANDACDGSGYGEGQTLIATKDITTDASGNYSSTDSFPTPPGAGPVVTATATDPANNTSEFSQCLTPETGGTIVVRKQTLPAGSRQSFAFTASYSAIGFSLSDGQSNTSAALAPGSYSVSETPVPGWDSSATCSNGSPASNIDLGAGESVTCTFTNTQRGKAKVVKTVSGAAPSGSQSFAFELRQGASTSSAGTILESGSATASNGGVVNFTTTLKAGTTYALCETVMPGWMTTLGAPFYVVYNPSGDNSTVCTDFSVSPGQTKSFAIDNKPPPGGLARTIGFWKNWSSCSGSNGKQRPVLDQTLAASGSTGITIGVLTLHAADCLKAVRLLNKSTIDTGKKMSSDPAFNLAAQLLAAKLNVAAGAGTCPAAVSAINNAQTLLAAVHFNGITHDKLSGAQATQANSLATILDRYNNNLLC